MGLAESFRVLADPQRRDILLLLRSGRRSAGELAQLLQLTPSALSYHLKLLRQAGLLLEYREKNYIYYELNATVLDELLLWVQQLKGEIS